MTPDYVTAAFSVAIDALKRIPDAPDDERKELAREGLIALHVLAQRLTEEFERSARLLRQAAAEMDAP